MRCCAILIVMALISCKNTSSPLQEAEAPSAVPESPPTESVRHPSFQSPCSGGTKIGGATPEGASTVDKEGASYEGSATLDRLVERAETELRRGGSLKSMAGKLETALRQHPDNVRLLALVGWHHAISGKRKQAEAILEDAEELSPNHPYVLLLRGIIAQAAHDDEKAAGYFEQVLDLDPGNLSALLFAGRLELRGPDPKKGEQHLAQAIRQDPILAAPQGALGEYFLTNGRLDDAKELLNCARDLMPDSIQILVLHGKLMLELNQPTEAEADFRAVLDRSKQDHQALVSLPYSLALQKKFDEAEKAAAVATKTLKGDPWTAYNMACGYAIDNQGEKAVKWLTKATAVSPFLKKRAQQDKAFVALRDSADFKSLVE